MKASQRLVPVVIVFLLLGWQFEFAIRVFLSDLGYFQIQREMVFWGSGDARPSREQVDLMAGRLEDTVALWNDQPDYLALQARIFAWNAVLAPASQRVDYVDEAASLMRLSLAQRPANAYSWAQYAEYLRALPGKDVELNQAVNKAITLAPGDTDLALRMRRLLVR